MKLMWTYVKKNRLLALAVVLLGFVGWGMLTGSNIFIQRLVDLVIDSDTNRFIQVLLQGAVFVAAAGVMYFLSQAIGEKFMAFLARDIRNDLYDAVMRRTRPHFNEKDTAEYISAVSNDVNSLSGTFSVTLWMVNFVAGGGSALVIMLLYSLPLTLVAVGSSVLSLILPLVFSKSLKRRQLAMTEKQAEFTVDMKELFGGHEVISSFNLLDVFRRRFFKTNKSLTKADYRLSVMRQGVTSTGYMLNRVTDFIMILVAGFLVMNGTITLGVFTLFMALSGTLSNSVTNLFQMMPILSSMKPVADKVTAFMDYENRDFTGSTTATLAQKIEMRGVGFHYKEEYPILRDFSLTINKNEKIALVGPSGAGKTTLIKLLSGDYANYTGEIAYDGTPLRDLAPESLRRLMTVIHQNTYIFNESICFNICLGEDFPEEALNRALQQSGVTKFLPDIAGGLEAPCGEKGCNLSGGQKQRIAIARSLVRGAKFLVLDEGVSAVDVETANEIEQELLAMPDLTLLTVTHRIKDGLLNQYNHIVQLENLSPNKPTEEAPALPKLPFDLSKLDLNNLDLSNLPEGATVIRL